MLGVIGGTGMYSLGKFEEQNVNTPYGFAAVYIGTIAGNKCAFIPRHGKEHIYPPHKVNYKANVWALRQVGAEEVLATYACGAISKYKPGDLVVADDFIGFSAPITFYDDFREGFKHVDFTEPYAKAGQAKLISAAKECGISLKKGGVVGTTHGPRFETRAEIKALGKMGANLANMTNAYEATLLHELGIPCAGLCIVTNYAAGAGKGARTHSEVVNMMVKKERDVNAIVRAFAKMD